MLGISILECFDMLSKCLEHIWYPTKIKNIWQFITLFWGMYYLICWSIVDGERGRHRQRDGRTDGRTGRCISYKPIFGYVYNYIYSIYIYIWCYHICKYGWLIWKVVLFGVLWMSWTPANGKICWRFSGVIFPWVNHGRSTINPPIR